VTPPPASSLPIVLLPIGTDDDALDACLGALDAGTPAGTRLWLADDAQAGPRALAIIERWLTRTSLQADYTRRPRMLGEVAHMDQMLAACGDVDVVVLSPDAQPLPGWLQQLAACLARDAAIATATPWCNAGETAAWPRLGEVSPPPDDVERTAKACAAMPPLHPELPGLGWRNVLCETAFVARGGEGGPADGDMDALNARWPTFTPRLATFLMDDPLRGPRERLAALYADIGSPERQRDLFG
jgi:hypothetical protein